MFLRKMLEKIILTDFWKNFGYFMALKANYLHKNQISSENCSKKLFQANFGEIFWI